MAGDLVVIGNGGYYLDPRVFVYRFDEGAGTLSFLATLTHPQYPSEFGEKIIRWLSGIRFGADDAQIHLRCRYFHSPCELRCAGESIAISLSGLLIVGAPSVATRIESEGVVLGYQVNSTAGTVESLFTVKHDECMPFFFLLFSLFDCLFEIHATARMMIVAPMLLLSVWSVITRSISGLSLVLMLHPFRDTPRS